MMASPTLAANANASLARLTEPASGLAKGAQEGPGGPNFGDLVKDAIGSLTQASRTSDAQSQAMAAGKGNIVDVVTAVAETEVAIDTLVSVRDTVVQAYEESWKVPFGVVVCRCGRAP
jgi:flagellar hook-basal body complex protein FliE